MIPKESAWGYREDVTQRFRATSGIVQMRLPAFDLDLMGQLVGARVHLHARPEGHVNLAWLRVLPLDEHA
jgi:hypothetical protein